MLNILLFLVCALRFTDGFIAGPTTALVALSTFGSGVAFVSASVIPAMESDHGVFAPLVERAGSSSSSSSDDDDDSDGDSDTPPTSTTNTNDDDDDGDDDDTPPGSAKSAAPPTKSSTPVKPAKQPVNNTNTNGSGAMKGIPTTGGMKAAVIAAVCLAVFGQLLVSFT